MQKNAIMGCLGCLVSVLCLPAGAGLELHWGFEGANEKTALDGWRFARARGECFGKWDDEHAASDRYSLRLSIPKDATARAHWVAPRVPVKPNTGYRISLRIKALNTTGETYAIAYENGKQIPKYWHVTPKLSGTHDWQKFQLSFQTRPDTHFLVLVCKLRHGTGFAWFDDVTVEEVPLTEVEPHVATGLKPPADDGFPLQAVWTPAQWTQHGVLYVVRGYLNPLSVFFRGKRKDIQDPELVIEVPADYSIRGPLVRGRGPLVPDARVAPVIVKHDGKSWRRVRLRVPTNLLFAGRFLERFHWENYFHVGLDVPTTAPTDGSFRWRFGNAGKPGPWHKLTIKACAPPPPVTCPPDFRLIIQHTGPLRHPNPRVRARLTEFLKLGGIRGGLAPSYYDPELADADRQLAGLGLALHTWRFAGWDYANPGEFAAVNIDGKTLDHKICPQAQLAHAQPWFGDLETYYRSRLTPGLRRVIIDYEPASWWTMCYCPRCRRAFATESGLPLDECLKLSGHALRKRWGKQWAAFQAKQNGEIVKLHGALIRQIVPDEEVGLCSWDGTRDAIAQGHDIRRFEPDATFHAPMIYTKGIPFHDRVTETCRRTTRPVLPFVELFDLSQPRSLTPSELRMNLLATGFAGGGGAVLWVGMECLDAQYLTAAARAVREIAAVRARVPLQAGPSGWVKVEPIAEKRGTVMVDGRPVPIRGVTGAVRVHQWGSAQHCAVAVLNYDKTSPVQVRIRAVDGALCRFESVMGDGTMEPGKGKITVLSVPPGNAVAVVVERE